MLARYLVMQRHLLLLIGELLLLRVRLPRKIVRELGDCSTVRALSRTGRERGAALMARLGH